MAADPGDVVPDPTVIQRQMLNATRGLLLIAVIAAIYVSRDFLMPVVLATFIALTFRPAVRSLSHHYVPPWLAAAILAIVLVGGGLYASYLLSGQISTWIEQVPQLADKLSSKFSGLRASFEAVSNITEKLQDVSTPVNSPGVQQVVVRESALPAMLGLITGYPVQLLITLGATLAFAVFLMASGDLFYEKLVRVLPTMTDKKQALHIVYDIEDNVSNYMLTLTAINAGLGVAVAAAFHLLGMPSPLLWGLLIFFFNFIPYVGAVSGVALSALVASVTFDSLSYALLVPLALTAISLLESEVVNPLVIGRRLQMNAVAILLSLAFWAWLWGIAGAALAVPMLVTLKVFCDHVEGLSGLGEFIAVRQNGKVAVTDTVPDTP